MFAFGASTAAYAYNAMLRYNPDPSPGKELPDGIYDGKYNGGRPPRGYNVIGFNNRHSGEFWADFGKQSGALSSAANYFPGLNAVAGLHDYWMNNVSFNLMTNIGTMVPAAAITYAGFLGGQFSPIAMQMINTKSGRR